MYRSSQEEIDRVRNARTSPNLESENQQEAAAPLRQVVQNKDWTAELIKQEEYIEEHDGQTDPPGCLQKEPSWTNRSTSRRMEEHDQTQARRDVEHVFDRIRHSR
jgi:hypothetical protein